MDEVEPTLGRSLKIWWSFVWRGMVLMFAIMIPLELIAVFTVFNNMHLGNGGTPPGPDDLKRIMLFFPFVWLVMVGVMVLTQSLAMRWMLRKAQWSDFRLVVASKS